MEFTVETDTAAIKLLQRVDGIGNVFIFCAYENYVSSLDPLVRCKTNGGLRIHLVSVFPGINDVNETDIIVFYDNYLIQRINALSGNVVWTSRLPIEHTDVFFTWVMPLCETLDCIKVVYFLMVSGSWKRYLVSIIPTTGVFEVSDAPNYPFISKPVDYNPENDTFLMLPEPPKTHNEPPGGYCWINKNFEKVYENKTDTGRAKIVGYDKFSKFLLYKDALSETKLYISSIDGQGMTEWNVDDKPGINDILLLHSKVCFTLDYVWYIKSFIKRRMIIARQTWLSGLGDTKPATGFSE